MEWGGRGLKLCLWDSWGNWIGSYRKREERSTKNFSNRFVVADAWTSVFLAKKCFGGRRTFV